MSNPPLALYSNVQRIVVVDKSAVQLPYRVPSRFMGHWGLGALSLDHSQVMVAELHRRLILDLETYDS